jgi:uncharacterized membrane protein
MSASKTLRTLACVVALGGIARMANAGGPLFISPDTKTAYVFAPGTIPVYYDQGNLAVLWDYSQDPPVPVILDNAVGKALVENGFGAWSGVPTTSLRTNVAGDLSALGLSDITAANVTDVIGAFNGGGIHVIFDADGSIMENFFGLGPNVLGISTPESAQAGTNIILESWTVLNGRAISPDDIQAEQFQGVATHEFGHALGLAHTQTNGAALFFADPFGPAGCTTLPYPTNATSADTETMYPFSNPSAGAGQGNVHTLDDMAAISDLYPGTGWPDAYGSIEGKVLDLDGTTELTGVNVIARNLADPYANATSALSGGWSQGQFGPDGTFRLHGLTPGARYVLYVDALLAGGFATPPTWFLPGAERFYGGPKERAEGAFNACHAQPISARRRMSSTIPVKPITANIRFRRVKGAPILFNLGYGTGASDISGDGKIVVGNWGRGGPVFRWTEETGLVDMGVPSSGEITTISRNGAFVSSNVLDTSTDTEVGTFRWDAEAGWLQVAPTGSCGTDTTDNFGVDNDGNVYGLSYNSCSDYKAFRWNPGRGTTLFPSATTKGDGTPANGRPNRVSADASTIVGWEETDEGQRVGVVWLDGTPHALTDAHGQPLGEGYATSSEGSVIIGEVLPGQAPVGYGWRKNVATGKLDFVKPLSPDASPLRPFAVSAGGTVVAGLSGDPWFSWSPAPFLWTRQMGSVDLGEFLKRQGTSSEQYLSLWTPMAISDAGNALAGWGYGAEGYASWVLQIPNAFVCHSQAGSEHTLSVAFPGSFDGHLAHGDTVGPCQDHQR